MGFFYTNLLEKGLIQITPLKKVCAKTRFFMVGRVDKGVWPLKKKEPVL